MKIRYSDIFDQIVENAISQRISSERSYRDFAFQQLETVRGLPVSKLYETHELFMQTRPLERVQKAILAEAQALEEYVVDRIKHPKYGDLYWDNANGINTIQRNNRTAYRGSHQEVAARWRELKQTADETQKVPKDMRIVDKRHHPTHGDIFWVEADGVNIIHRNGKIAYKGTREDVQRRWKELKASGQSDGNMRESDNKDVRDVNKPEGPDFSWISNFDVKEVSKAVGTIVDYLGQKLDDPQQVNVLRNDIRLLDNFATAVRSKDSHKIMQSWVIAKEQGATDHLHDEFVARMEQTIGRRRVNTEGLVFNVYGKWRSLAEDTGYEITESVDSKIATDPATGMMVGYWTEQSGWLYDPNDTVNTETLLERAPPGEESWVKSNKAKFIDQYGDSKGIQMLYATAWRRYNKASGSKKDSKK